MTEQGLLVAGADAPLAAENKLHYPALDGLRAVAILMVFAEHYLGALTPAWAKFGWAGVDVFFVLSGFLITGILYDTRNKHGRIRTFYARRTLRIFPLYYAIFFLIFVTSSFLHWILEPGFSLWLLYLGNFVRFIFHKAFVLHPLESISLVLPRYAIQFHIGHFWSLAIEEQFYLVWPMVVFLVKDRRRLQKICMAITALTPFLRLAARLSAPHGAIVMELLYRATPFRVDALLIGSLLALWLRGEERGSIFQSGRSFVIGGFGVFVIGWVAVALSTHVSILDGSPLGWTQTFGYTFLDFAFLGVVILTIQTGTFLYRVLNVSVLKRLGTISYGFYVFHDLPHEVYVLWSARIAPATTPSNNLLLTAALAFVGTLILSISSFHLLERPFLRLKDRFTVRG